VKNNLFPSRKHEATTSKVDDDQTRSRLRQGSATAADGIFAMKRSSIAIRFEGSCQAVTASSCISPRDEQTGMIWFPKWLTQVKDVRL
jgi:hypothetical protein